MNKYIENGKNGTILKIYQKEKLRVGATKCASVNEILRYYDIKCTKTKYYLLFILLYK